MADETEERPLELTNRDVREVLVVARDKCKVNGKISVDHVMALLTSALTIAAEEHGVSARAVVFNVADSLKTYAAALDGRKGPGKG